MRGVGGSACARLLRLLLRHQWSGGRAAVLCARGGPLSTGEHVLLPVSGRLLRPVPFHGIGIANVHLSSFHVCSWLP